MAMAAPAGGAGAGAAASSFQRSNGNGNGSINGVQQPRRRISYLIPPPPASQPPPLLSLPDPSHAARARRGNPNPLIILQDPLINGDGSTNDRRRTSTASAGSPTKLGSSISSASLSSTHSPGGAGSHRIRQQLPQRHPEHTLGVSALVLDTTTILESPSASPSNKSGHGRPAGILYSGGRDGLVAAWELGLPFKKRTNGHHHEPGGLAFEAGEEGRIKRARYRPRWSEDPYDSQEDEESVSAEGDESVGADSRGSRSSSSDEEDQAPRYAFPRATQQQQQRNSLRIDTSGDSPIPSGSLSMPGGRKKRSKGLGKLPKNHDMPYERRWQVDLGALDDKIPPRTTFRQAHRSHTDWVNDLVLCNLNQTLISASSDRLIRAWNPHDPHRSMLPAVLGSHNDYVKALAHSRAAGWLASGGLDRKLKLWDIMESRAQPILDISLDSSVYAVATNVRGSTIAVGSPGKVIYMYDPRTSQPAARLVGHADNVRSLVLSEDGRHVLSASSDGTVKLWSAGMQRCLHTFTHHSESVWALHSTHPELEVFYSGDRAGAVCKVDFAGAGDIASEGECIVLLRNRDEHRPGNSSANDGIHKIVALDDAFVWTASGTSSISRWRDVQPKSTRMPNPASTRRNSLADAPHYASQTQGLLSGSQSSNYNYGYMSSSPAGADHDESPLHRTLSGERGQSVSFAAQPAPNQRSVPGYGSLVNRPSSLRFHQRHGSTSQHAYSSSPGAPLVPIASSPRMHDDPFNPPSPVVDTSKATMNGIPFESLVPLFTPDDPYSRPTLRADGTAGHGYSASVLSLHRVSSRPLAGGFGSSVTPPTSNLAAPRMPLGLGRAQSPMSSNLLGYNRPSSIQEAEEVMTPMEEKPSPAFLLARQEYEDRESALDALPLRLKPDDVIRGRHGLVRSELLNDRRTVLTLDTLGDVAVWDIVLGGCIGRFSRADLRQSYNAPRALSANGSVAGTDLTDDEDAGLEPEDVLEYVKKLVEGEAVVASWCSVETKTGLLTVHIEQNRAFDAEVYLDEAGVPPKPEYRVDQRLNIGKWVLRNLFDGFIKEEVKGQARGRSASLSSSNPSSYSNQDGVLAHRPSHISMPEAMRTSTAASGTEGTSWASHFSGLTEGFNIALATPAMTPAVLPDVSDLAAQMASPRLFSSSLASSSNLSSLPTIPQSPQGGTAPSTPLSTLQKEGDYFSFSRPRSGVQDGAAAGAATPRALSSTPVSSSAPSSAKPSKMSRFKSFGKKDSRKDSVVDSAATPSVEEKPASSAEQDKDSHLSPAERSQQALLRAVFAHALQPPPWSETPAIRFVTDLPMIISEEAHDAGAWATVYRGTVSRAGQDVATLEMNMPPWLLEFCLHGIIAQKEQAKIAFVMEPYSGPEKALLPELPSGNARLSATRMLRMRKACHYIAEKLELESWRQRQAYLSALEAQHGSSGGGNSPPSAAALARTTTRSSLSSSHSYSHLARLGSADGAGAGVPEPTLLPEDEIEIICNDQPVPLGITLAACAKYAYGKGGDVMLYYRRRNVHADPAVSAPLVDI